MKKHNAVVILIVAGAFCALASVRAESGPLEIPTPFEEVNRRVELAAGESYLLNGWIRLNESGGRVLFEVDLGRHPWLANTQRIKSPFYLVTRVGRVMRYRDRKVLLRATAKGSVVQTDDGHMEYQVQLEAAEPPVLE